MKKILFIIPFLFPFMAFASASTTCFLGSNFEAANANANGVYTYLDSGGGSYYGRMPERWVNTNGFYIYTEALSGSMLVGTDTTNYISPIYTTSAPDPTTLTWENITDSSIWYRTGDVFIPSANFSVTSCGGGGGGGSSTTALAPLFSRTSTALVAGAVSSEVVAFPIFIFKTYGGQLTWIAIIFAVVAAIYGVTKLVKL